jgi:hypothetical protein
MMTMNHKKLILTKENMWKKASKSFFLKSLKKEDDRWFCHQSYSLQPLHRIKNLALRSPPPPPPTKAR